MSATDSTRSEDAVLADLQRRFEERQRSQTGTTSTDTSKSVETAERPCECGRGLAKALRLAREIRWFRCEHCRADELRAEAERDRDEADAKAEALLRDRLNSLPESLGRMGVTRKYLHVTM